MKVFSARECVVEHIEPAVANQFLHTNHRQGAAAAGLKSVNLGLFKDSELLAVIQFCSPRTAGMQRKYTAELLRLAFAREVRVRGGASKLIQAYIRTYNPSDFFTYQDTSGEATSVYEHAGMSLVSSGKRKQYLVAPGKTLETGSRKEVLGIPYVTRFGPDRILGTKLGQIYREDGTRKTNPQIFVEELGWHIEETSGDRVYEWVNPNVSFYTYKITASDSDKYYYGVSRINKANPSKEDCLKDGYYGSDGKNPNNKFRNWQQRHKGKLQKQVIAIYARRQQAFAAERELIGESWRTDPLCLNSRAGGAISPPSTLESKARGLCPIHGESGFVGGKCRSCVLDSLQSIQHCEIHGEVSHFAGQCRSCLIRKSMTVEECPIHGEELFRGGKCQRCFMQKALTVKECPVHGESVHMGKSCALCTSAKVFQQKECPTHGITKFVGERCSKCMHGKAFYMDTCSTHGETKHKGGKCYKCQTSKAWRKDDCPIHGNGVTFHGTTCLRCRREKK